MLVRTCKIEIRMIFTKFKGQYIGELMCMYNYGLWLQQIMYKCIKGSCRLR